jgi:FSR family fosmidomycin resistance protein-like MFS transporter
MPCNPHDGAMNTSEHSPRQTYPLADGRRLWLLSVGHTVDDFYQGAVYALIPLLLATRHWSYSEASGLTVAAAGLSSVLQPLFGHWGDRRARPWLVPTGLALAGLGVGCAAVSHVYALTWGALALSGVGVAAFHPEAARLARRFAGRAQAAMSRFVVGGTIGFALAPAVIGTFVGTSGLRRLPVLGIPALLCAIAIAGAVHRPGPQNGTGPDIAGALPGPVDDWSGFARLTVAVMARSVVTTVLGTFLALWMERRLQVPPTAGERALVMLYGVGALSTFAGGRLAHRWGPVSTMRAAYTVAVPTLALVWLASGWMLWGAVALTAIVLYVPFSVQVTLSQDYLPTRIGVASGVALGFAVSVGGLASPLWGFMADRWGLSAALASLIPVVAICAIIAFALRDPAAI